MDDVIYLALTLVLAATATVATLVWGRLPGRAP
jgi:hypothetical protein